MSHFSLVIGNHLWPVGEHDDWISPSALQLLDFLRIEADTSTGLVDVKIEDLERWNVVRGWDDVDYYHGLIELTTCGTVVHSTGAPSRDLLEDHMHTTPMRPRV